MRVVRGICTEEPSFTWKENKNRRELLHYLLIKKNLHKQTVKKKVDKFSEHLSAGGVDVLEETIDRSCYIHYEGFISKLERVMCQEKKLYKY